MTIIESLITIVTSVPASVIQKCSHVVRFTVVMISELMAHASLASDFGECISQRRETIVDRIEALLHPDHRMHRGRFSCTINWANNVIRELLAARGEEW